MSGAPVPRGLGPGAAEHGYSRAENLTTASRVQYGEECEPPGLGEAMGGIAQRIKDNLSLTWRWFNYWRRRYVWLRLVIILLVFAKPVYGVFRPVIRDLVVIAVIGIEAAKVGPRFETRALEHLEKKRLQTALLARFDKDEDGRLDRDESAALEERTGLAPDEVEGSALDVELDPLVEASHELGLLPPTTTARDFRREALAAALAQRDQEHKALWEEAGVYLDMQYPTLRDYLKWETWWRGIGAFRDVLGYGLGLSVGDFFAGLRRQYPEAESPWFPPPRSNGYTGWLVVLAAVIVSVRRYGTGLELQRRFREDAQLAAAPCPICGKATNDYGALRQHRFSRACATAAVVGLACFVVGALRLPQWQEGLALVAIPAAGVIRWVLWPREVHACHRRQSLLYVGFGAALVLVVGLLSRIAAHGMHTFGYPRQQVVVLAGPRWGEATDRRREASARRATRDASRGRHVATTSRRGRQPNATGAQRRRTRGMVGPDSSQGRRRASARQRTRHRERIAARRARRAAARQAAPGR